MTEQDFTHLIDLVSDKLGGTVLEASDDFFAEKENLIKPGRGIFIPGKYTDRGKWMDGWESRRKRVPGHDWCILKLAVPGVIKGFDIDTNYFLGNHPPFASVEGCFSQTVPSHDKTKWTELVAKSPLKPGSQNLFESRTLEKVNFLKLNIFPDGGVARFRAFGIADPDWKNASMQEDVDYAAARNGAIVLECNDMFFSPKDNLIMPGRSVNMGDGWETRRRRVPGNDWLVLQLARTIHLSRIEIDTDHYKGNYPDTCSIEGCLSPKRLKEFDKDSVEWKEVLPRQKLNADYRHSFAKELTSSGPTSHLRLNIYPDGGIARLRVYGEPT